MVKHLIRIAIVSGLVAVIVLAAFLPIATVQAQPAVGLTVTPRPTRTPWPTRVIPDRPSGPLPVLPLPNFLTLVPDIANWAHYLVEGVNDTGLLWIIAGLGLAGGLLAWLIHTVRNPPRF